MVGTAEADVRLRFCSILALVLLWGCVETRWIKDRVSLDISVRTNPYNIRDNCSNSASTDVPEQQPCRRVCHPEDCFLSTPGQLIQSKDNSARLEVLDFQLRCIVKMSKMSYRIGCFDKDHVYNITEQFIEEFVQEYNISPSPLSNHIYSLDTVGSGVHFPTVLYHKKFSICSKFTLTKELNTSSPTSFLAFSTADHELFRVSLYSGGKVLLQTVNSGAAMFESSVPFSVGSITSLCVSFGVKPAIQAAVWIWTEGEMLTRLPMVAQTPLYHLAAWNLPTLLGVVSIGESPMRIAKGYPSFVGDVYSIRVSKGFLQTKRQVLKFIRCEKNPLNTLKSVIAGVVTMAIKKNETQFGTVAMATQQNETLCMRRITGDVRVRDENEEDKRQYCGDTCMSCKARCMVADTNCSFIKSCASCEQLSCPDSTHYQRTYRDKCETVQKGSRCNSTAIANCYQDRNDTCQDLEDTIVCLRMIDLDTCAFHMWEGSLFEWDIKEKYGHCDSQPNRSAQIKELIEMTSMKEGMSECGDLCVISSGLRDLSVTHHESFQRKLKMNDNSELCSAVSSYLSCIELENCAERDIPAYDYNWDHSHVSWLYPTVERIFMIDLAGCNVPRSCVKLLNSEHGQIALRNVQEYNEKHGIPRQGADLQRANRYRMIPLPTRKEIIRCKKRTKTQTSNPTLITTEQQDRKSRKPRRSGTRKGDPQTNQERMKRSALSDIRSYFSKMGSKIKKDLKDLFSPEPKIYLEIRNKRTVIINKTDSQTTDDDGPVPAKNGTTSSSSTTSPLIEVTTGPTTDGIPASDNVMVNSTVEVMTEEIGNLTGDNTSSHVNSTVKIDKDIEPADETEIVSRNETETSRDVNSTVTINGIIVFDHSDGQKGNSDCPESSLSSVLVAFLISRLLA